METNHANIFWKLPAELLSDGQVTQYTEKGLCIAHFEQTNSSFETAIASWYELFGATGSD